jgi:hypothetical protein
MLRVILRLQYLRENHVYRFYDTVRREKEKDSTYILRGSSGKALMLRHTESLATGYVTPSQISRVIDQL